MQQRVLGVFALAMINVAAIVSLRNLPLMAMHGFASITFYIVAALLFLIPSALVCAELATGWPQSGGMYRWVQEAFGPRFGFFAIWSEWMLTVSFFPTLISFTVATLAYLIDPSLVHNKVYMVSTLLFIFWGATFLNFWGMRASSWLSTIGVILGTLLPGILIMGMGFTWYFLNPTPHIHFSWSAIVPDLRLDNIVFLVGVILGFEGMELIAFHVNEVKNPRKSYPKAILVATLAILMISILGSLSLALVVPPAEIRLVDGVMQTFSTFFNALPHSWIVAPELFVKGLALLLFIGSAAGLSTWIAGPAKGVLDCVEAGFVPKWLQKTNAKGVPVAALSFQACVATALSMLFILMPSIETAYWMLTVLATLFALLMYFLIFGAVISLRYTQPHVSRAYCIPGGKWGVWFVGGTGILGCLFAFIISFIPPLQLEETGKLGAYQGILILGLLVLSIPPLLLGQKRKI